MGTLNINYTVLGYEDSNATNNPRQKAVDWNRQLGGLIVNNPGNIPYSIPALQSVECFNGTQVLGYDSTTSFSIALVPNYTNRYRLVYNSGSNPVFRTARTLAVATGTLTLTVQANATVTVTSSLGNVFGSIQAGDNVYIPGTTIGDTAGPFDPLNEGLWSVILASNSSITIVRDITQVFSGVTETVAMSSNAQFRVFSSDGVQVDDILDIFDGFATAYLRSYEIVGVTDTFLEFVSGVALPTGTFTPGAGSFVCYSEGKQFLLIESDQEIAVRLNGDEDNTLRVEPILAGNAIRPGFCMHTGTVYRLVIINRSLTKAKVRVVTAE